MGRNNKWNRKNRRYCTSCGKADYELWPKGLGPYLAWDSQSMWMDQNRPFCANCLRKNFGIETRIVGRSDAPFDSDPKKLRRA